jgi:hypothetical protein
MAGYELYALDTMPDERLAVETLATPGRASALER